jgi:hypothetical protein
MYHFFVSGHVQDWQGEPWQIELGRCVREYTADAITKRYGGFTPAQVDELRRYPCIFAYEAVHSKNPLFGLIQNVTARQGQVRVEYELHPVDPFLSAEQLEQLTFRVGYRQMGNEPHTLGSERRCSGEGTSPPRHHSSCLGAQRGQWRRHHEAPVRRGAFIPGRVAAIGRKIAAALEGMLGPDRYFYDNNYKAQLARPSLDVLLQDIYRNRSKLIVVFVGSDYRRKEWCGIELRAFREILLERGYERIMFVRLDDGEVEGVFRTDGYVDARHHSPSEIAHFIQHRVALL